jgi:hypothetical protein
VVFPIAVSYRCCVESVVLDSPLSVFCPGAVGSHSICCRGTVWQLVCVLLGGMIHWNDGVCVFWLPIDFH